MFYLFIYISKGIFAIYSCCCTGKQNIFCSPDLSLLKIMIVSSQQNEYSRNNNGPRVEKCGIPDKSLQARWKKDLTFLMIKNGIPFGPGDFLSLRLPIISDTHFDSIGERKNT